MKVAEHKDPFGCSLVFPYPNIVDIWVPSVTITGFLASGNLTEALFSWTN